MKSKSLFYIAILLVVLLGIGTVSASENVSDVDMTLGDSNSVSPVYVDNWASLESYCESPNDQIICLNGSFSIGSQIEIKNNVNIIGDANHYIGGTADNVDSYSSVAFLCNDALNVSFTNVNFQYTGGKNLMQFSGNGNYELENCNFDNLNSGTDNSIIWSNYGVINVNNCSFSDCTVKTGVINNYYAANVATFNNARLYVTDSRFINNNASSHSGAIANTGYLVVENTIFDGNNATSWAGAIHTAAYANTSIYDSTFINNVAGWNGGALYTYCNLQIYNSTFIGNNCTTNNGGGAIGACKVFTEPNVYIVDSYFENNFNNCTQYTSSSTTSLGRGGAISIMDDGTLKVYNNTFVGNDAVIGTAICALSGGSYGSPDVEIIGNDFINHTSSIGSDLLIISLSNSNYLVENNTYSNNNISIGKFRLDIDDNNGNVTVNVTLRLKHPENYDSDIITKSGFEVYVDNVYNKTVYDTTFTLNFADNINHNVKVVPLCLAGESRNKNINDAKYNTIYVSTTGSNLNNGITRNTAVRTISKAIELATTVDYIKILEGTYYERDLLIPYEVTIEGEGNVILDGSSLTDNTFDVNASVTFNNLQFTGITGGSAINIVENKYHNYTINIDNCLFYSNNVADKLINAINLNIEDSALYDNTINYLISSDCMNMVNCIVEDNDKYSTSARSIQTKKGSIVNSTFSNNVGYYGIIYLTGEKSSDIFEISESKFLNNNAYRGGAIYTNSIYQLNIDSSIFYNNHATNYGGAIYLYTNAKNLNISNSILINNIASGKNRNYQIDRQSTTSNIFAINNWWGNTIDNPYVAPTFQSNNNVNASIWLILNVTSNVTSLASGESALVTFDLTYTNILGSDAPPEYNITGNLTPFCIDGTLLPILDGVLTATNGNVNVTNVSLVDGKVNVLFTATGTNPYLTISIFGMSESISFNSIRMLPLNELNEIYSNSIKIGEISSFKSTKDDLLSLSYDEVLKDNPDDWKYFYIELCQYTNGLFIIPDFECPGVVEYIDDIDIMEILNQNYDGDPNFHINISFFNSSSNSWEILVEDSFHMPFPGYFRCLQGMLPEKIYGYFLNFSRGMYNISCVYDGQELTWEDFDGNVFSFEYNPDSWSFTFDTSLVSYNPTFTDLSNVVDYEDSSISVNPKISMDYMPTGRSPEASYFYDLCIDDTNVFDYWITNSPCSKTSKVASIMMQETRDLVQLCNLNMNDFPEIKPVNITMTITQGNKVVKEFNISSGDTYSIDDLQVGEYNLTAVFDDSFYGYADKTVTITVNKHIWDNVGADEGYSHQTEYYGSKNVEPLWNLSVDANNFNSEDKYQSSVIDSNGNIYVVNGTKILVIDSDGNLIKTLAITSDGQIGIFSKGLALYNNYLICSVGTATMQGAYVWDINNNYAQSEFPYGGMGEVADKISTTSYYAPVVSNGKVYISSWQYYSDNDHIYEWTTNTHSNPFPRSTGAPSIDSAGYIYVNTKSGLYILDPELNIMDLSFGDAGKYGRPVIDSADIAYVFNADRTKVYAINREADNPILWTTDVVGGACGAMAVDNGPENNALYIVGNDGILYKINRATGEMSEFYTLGTTSSSLLVDGRGTVYVGGDDGIMYAVTNEGKTLFKYDVGSPISKDLVLDNNGTLYVYANFTVYALTGAPRLYSEIIINVSDVSAKRNNTIVATLPENATGNVTFIIDDTIESGEIPIISGNATWIAPGLLSGNHTVKASWAGDTEYFGCDATEEFNVYKVNSTIDLEDSINYVGKLTQLNITLPEDAVGNVTVTFNRKTETVKIVNGTATFETTSLEAGNYTIDFSWEGDERYFGNSGYAYFTVIKNDASLTIDAEPIKEGEDLKVTVTVSDDESGIVLIMVGDVKDFAEIKGGKAEFAISGLTADTYDINAIYLGDNKYYNTTETSQVTVSAKDTATIEIRPEVITEDDNQSIEVTLPDDATGNVLVEVNGNTFYAEVNGGKVNVPVSGLKANTTYPVSVTYSGDDNYSSATKDGEITTPAEEIIEPKDPELKAAAQNSTVSVSVNKDATGSVVVDVDGTSYYAEIENGQAVIDIKGLEAGKDYVATVIYSGDENFTNASETVDISIPAEPVVEPKDPELKAVAQNSTVSVSVNKDATGSVVVDVDGTSYYAEIENGQAVIDIKGLEAGKDYVATVVYSGDENFTNASETVDISIPAEPVVEPKDPELKAVAQNSTVSVSVNKDATGSVVVDVDGTSYYAEIENGQAVIDIKGLEAGKDYVATVVYSGDENFKNATTTVEISIPAEPVVEPKDPGLKASAKNSTVTVGVNKDATGGVVVDVDGTSYYAEINNGRVVVDVKGLEAGEKYSATVVYLGDENFKNATTTVEISIPAEPVVEPKDPGLKASAKNSTVAVSVNKDATGGVVVDVDGTSYYAEINNGRVVVDVKGLEAGEKYSATVVYLGDENFKNATTTVEINIPEEPVVEPKDPELKASATNNTIAVNVDKAATGNVLVDVDGQGYYAEIKDGQATINVIGLDDGTYEASITYVGDEAYKAANTTVSVTVPKKEDSTPEPVDSKADIKISEDSVDVELPKDATGYVLVDVDGKGYYAPVKDGKASIDLPELEAGNHTVTVTYTGDNKYQSANATKTISIEDEIETIIAEDLTKVEKAPDRFEATFNDANGKALANTEVTFTLNGVTYTRTTDASGKASIGINLDAGNYTILVTNTVTKESKELKINVLSRFAVHNDLTKYFRNASQYVVKILDDEGNPAKAGEVVTFNINGVFYNRTADANGNVKLNINLNPGDYIITSEYKGCRVSNNIKVLPILTGKDLTKKFGQPNQFEATLVDGQGKAYANQDVIFNINGVFYTRTTDANGVAKLNINLQAGKYIITSYYKEAVTSNTVTVTA